MLFAEADQAIFFESRDKKLAQPMNEFKIFRCGIPTVEQDRLCLNVFIFKCLTGSSTVLVEPGVICTILVTCIFIDALLELKVTQDQGVNFDDRD